MSRKTTDDKYTDAPADIADAIEHSVIISDTFPKPEELLKAPKKVRISIAVDAETLQYFKQEAENQGGKYQTMINNLLGAYARRHTPKR